LVEERLEHHDKFRSDVHPKGASEGDLDSFNICVDAYSNAFGVDVYNGKSGLTRGELFGLMSMFDYYMWSLKKSTKTSQTPAPSMDATSQELSEKTTSDISDCSKTPCDKSCDDPQTCATESLPPSDSSSADRLSSSNIS